MSELEITPAQARKEWAKDLRSGEFKQTIGVLRDPDTNSRCCLGVACDTYKRLTGKGNWDGILFREGEDDSASVLIPTVSKFFGLSSTDPCLDNQIRATYLNDELCTTFDKIADLVEKL